MENSKSHVNAIDNKEPWYSAKWNPYLLLAAICLLLYGVTLWFGFSPMDEKWIIIKEKGNLSSFTKLPHLFTSSTLGMYYRPMLALSFMIDTVCGDGNTFYFHLSNILLHLICCVLLFRFFLALEIKRSTSFLLALIFAVHPINIHAVVWIPGRNDSILTLFTLLSCIWLLRYLREGKIAWYVLHLFFFACTLFTKESAIVLPVIYFLLYRFFAKEKKIKTISIYIFIWVAIDIGWFLLRKFLVNYLPGNAHSFGESVANFFASIIIHTGKVLLPVQQSVMPLLTSTSLVPYLVAIGIVLALFLKYGVRNKRLAWLGIVWFFVLIALPAWLGAINDFGEHYEHRDYTPLAGALLFLSQLNLPISEYIAKRIALFIVIVFSIKTLVRLPVYRDEITYAQTGMVEAPTNSLFPDLLGMIYLEKHDYKAALDCFNRTIAIDSGNGTYFGQRGAAYGELGDLKHALEDDNQSLRLDSLETETYINRSKVYFLMGNFEQAKKDLDRGQGLGGNAPDDFVKRLNEAINREMLDSAKKN